MTHSPAPPLNAKAAKRVFLLLNFTRWFPVGLIIGITALLPLQRGMSLAELGVIFSAQGFVVLALELPTGGFADAIGRRPVLLASAVVGVISMSLFLVAQSFWMFVVALTLQGVFRALDSGPLEAWYVDTAHADDPEVPVEDALSKAGTVVGLGIASGALISGGIVAWHPIDAITAIELPVYISVALGVAHLVAIAVYMREPRTHVDSRGFRRALRSARGAPRTVADGIRLLGTSRVLLAIVLVEVFWAVGMIAFETLNSVRLAELAGGEDEAGALLGPVSAAAWGLFAAGSALAGLASRRIGVGWSALAFRVLNGAFIVVMGFMSGPVGLIVAFLITYTLHGAAGPMHSTLLHRQAQAKNRATVLSMNSMIGGGAYSLGLLVLGPLAEHTSTATAIIAAGAFSVLGAALYLPAIRQERAGRIPVPQADAEEPAGLS
jgi:predicted MFS family arabinose efflux permease